MITLELKMQWKKKDDLFILQHYYILLFAIYYRILQNKKLNIFYIKNDWTAILWRIKQPAIHFQNFNSTFISWNYLLLRTVYFVSDNFRKKSDRKCYLFPFTINNTLISQAVYRLCHLLEVLEERFLCFCQRPPFVYPLVTRRSDWIPITVYVCMLKKDGWSYRLWACILYKSYSRTVVVCFITI